MLVSIHTEFKKAMNLLETLSLLFFRISGTSCSAGVGGSELESDRAGVLLHS